MQNFSGLILKTLNRCEWHCAIFVIDFEYMSFTVQVQFSVYFYHVFSAALQDMLILIITSQILRLKDSWEVHVSKHRHVKFCLNEKSFIIPQLATILALRPFSNVYINFKKGGVKMGME